MSLKDLLEDFSKVIKPQQEEILGLLRNQQAHIEAAAAKIINELKAIIQDCPCNKEILKALDKNQLKDKEIISADDTTLDLTKGSRKYSYPNFSVGNEELGTGKNPGSLTWPFGVDNEKST